MTKTGFIDSLEFNLLPLSLSLVIQRVLTVKLFDFKKYKQEQPK
jgi:uncharacterized membrane protein